MPTVMWKGLECPECCGGNVFKMISFDKKKARLICKRTSCNCDFEIDSKLVYKVRVHVRYSEPTERTPANILKPGRFRKKKQKEDPL